MIIEKHRQVQEIAKQVHAELLLSISEGDTELSISEKAITLLNSHGISDTWYYDCPALVLLGSRSCLSISGREYVPNHSEKVGKYNLITVDLSPSLNGIWGDCARTFFIEKGLCKDTPDTPAFFIGAEIQEKLHKSLFDFATPATTFEDLFHFSNTQIESADFINLDFQKNLGHSIETRLENRIYIEEGNSCCLSEPLLFTFEPHIRSKKGQWGFKHENIYYFTKNKHLKEL